MPSSRNGSGRRSGISLLNRKHLSTPDRFSLEAAVLSHGWYQLAPFGYDAGKRELSYVFRRDGRERSVRASVAPFRGGLRVSARAENDELKAIGAAFARMLSFDQDLRGFHDRVRGYRRLADLAGSGEGRMLRSPTVFEDVVKTICTTNCSWALTKSMVARLVEYLGQDDGGGGKAFPSPAAMAERGERFYREEIKAGYRSAYLLEFAESVARGRIEPEAWLAPEITVGELRKNLLSVKGVGTYAAESMMKLLGRFDSLALDSFLRSGFYSAHNDGEACPDEMIEAHYERFGEWRGLAIWFDICHDDG